MRLRLTMIILLERRVELLLLVFLNIVIEEPRILPSNDLENEKEQLLNEFPEFRALIQNNPNITKEKLLKLKN